MSTTDFREQLHKQIDRLPNEIVEQIADFTLFMMARRRLVSPSYRDWGQNQWEAFVEEQFFREDDEVEYSLADAQEIYHP